MIKNELVYPIFLKCCEISDDDFWKYVFEELAYGRSPYGTYIKKGFLKYFFILVKIPDGGWDSSFSSF